MIDLLAIYIALCAGWLHGWFTCLVLAGRMRDD